MDRLFPRRASLRCLTPLLPRRSGPQWPSKCLRWVKSGRNKRALEMTAPEGGSDLAPGRLLHLRKRSQFLLSAKFRAQPPGVVDPSSTDSPRYSHPDIVRRTMAEETIRYVKSDGLNIAYQVTGRGPRDLVLIPGWVSHLQMDWAHPDHARFLDRLASFSRLIRFDKRGYRAVGPTG